MKEYTPEVFSIGVGNLTVGGTGKTPMVNYLCQILSDRRLGVISRGYGRKTKGFLELTPESTAEAAGDEPCMMAQRNPEVTFFVSEDRVKGYNLAHEAHPEINTFIFDDVFQHRYLQPHLRILLSDYRRPFYRDHVLPYGRLRETRSGAKRADMVVVTKCPENLEAGEKEEITRAIRAYTQPDVPVFFAEYCPSFPVNEAGESPRQGEEVVLLSALAQNETFYAQQALNFAVQKHFAFRDHYAPSLARVREILAWGKPVITTGKDMVKIREYLTPEERLCFYVPDVTVEADISFPNYIRRRMGFV